MDCYSGSEQRVFISFHLDEETNGPTTPKSEDAAKSNVYESTTGPDQQKGFIV